MFKKGKVRDIYQLSKKRLLIVSTDRVSAFDVVINQEIPDKGKVLTQLSLFWFRFLKKTVRSHFISERLPSAFKEKAEELNQRIMVVKKCKVIPVEWIVRGYLAGSLWKKYQDLKPSQGLKRVYPDLKEADKFLQPMVGYTTKAETGHDEDLNYTELLVLLENWLKENNFSQFEPKKLAIDLIWLSSAIYERALKYAISRGLIIADTKFEFGIDEAGNVLLVDEVLTPDSSRFWLLQDWRPGYPQQGYDKQPLRDWLEEIGWDKNSPPPNLSENIIEKTRLRYQEILKILTS